MIVLKLAAVIILGYLIGAIPFGVIAGKLARGIDVRNYGSGSMGTTNVLRTAGKGAAISVLLADMVKGIAAVAVAWAIFASSPSVLAWGLVAAGAAAVIGHNWPVYIGFRGGRGVTTTFGAFLLMCWPVALICLAIFIIVVAVTRYVSLGSLLGAIAMLLVMIPFVILGLEPYAYLIFGVIIVPLVVFRHRGNIKRLLSGTESKIGQKTEIE